MPVLDTYRKQAKLLVRWHREGNYSIGEKVRRLERCRALTDREVLALKFTLTMAQEIVAIEAGYPNWAALKAVAEGAEKIPRAEPGPLAFKSAVPILFVRDVERAAAFYHSTLGFTIDFLHGKPPFYGSVSRDAARLHFRFVHEPFFAREAAKEGSLILATIEVSDVRALFEEYKARDVEFTQSLVKHPWGGTDFHVCDPDGNVISFVTFG
jgi:uncharacterized glyoxalase superfamily protein PhnB